MRMRAECGASEGLGRHGCPGLHEGPAPLGYGVPRRQDSAERRAPAAQPGGGSGARPGGAVGEGRGGGSGVLYYNVLWCVCVFTEACCKPICTQGKQIVCVIRDFFFYVSPKFWPA